MFAIIRVCVAVLLLSGLSEQEELNYPCSYYGFTPLPSFAPLTINGNWYLYSAYDEGLPLREYKCIRFTNVLTYPGSGQINTTEVANEIATGDFTTDKSTMTFINTLGGKYTYKIESDPDVAEETEIVVVTSTFYIEHSCVDVDGKADIYIGVFTKSQNPHALTIAAINKYLRLHNIDPTTLRQVSQSPCTYKP